LHRIKSGNAIPIHDLGRATLDEIFIEGLDNADFAVKTFFVNMLFSIPVRFPLLRKQAFCSGEVEIM